MPVNRITKPVAEKRSQLVSAARDMLLSLGYEATSMSRIAQAARVTPNTIYWYFKDKDDLLIAVLATLLQEDLNAYVLEAQRASLPEQLMWLTGRLHRVGSLVGTVHNRMRESESVKAWHDHFHAVFEALLADKLPVQWSAEQRAAEIRVVTFTLEGLVSHGTNVDATRQTCDALVARWQAVGE